MVNPRVRAVIAVGLAVLLAAPALGVVVGLVWGSEKQQWLCPVDAAPAFSEAGERACFTQDGDLPEGFTWEVWGNRPAPGSCSGGEWRRIRHLETGTLDCVSAGTRIPPEWTVED